jgi:cephalosporin-C deacetylase-like acetyl esterase
MKVLPLLTNIEVLFYCLFLTMAPIRALQRDVEFRTVDGIMLRGVFYAPTGDEKMPCIIMTHGVFLSLNFPVVKLIWLKDGYG